MNVASQVIHRRIAFISSCMSKEISMEKLSKITYAFKPRKINIGDIIYNENDESNHLYIVKRGLIEL